MSLEQFLEKRFEADRIVCGRLRLTFPAFDFKPFGSDGIAVTFHQKTVTSIDLAVSDEDIGRVSEMYTALVRPGPIPSAREINLAVREALEKMGDDDGA